MTHLLYEEPAKKWEEALPLGNGRMGAMIFGQPVDEHMQFNEDSIWYGGPIDRINADAKKQLPEIRRLIKCGQIPEAERLMLYSLSGTPQSQRPYQTAGDMELKFSGLSGEISNYCRELDLNSAIAKVSFDYEEGRITKEYFASYPDQVIAVHIVSSKPGKISFSLLLTRGRFYDHGGKLSDDSVYLDGTLGEGENHFVLAARAIAKGGDVRVLGEHLLVEQADEVTIYISIETSFYNKESILKTVLKRLQAAGEKGYAAIRAEHFKDYQRLFGRVSLKLGDSEEDSEYFAEKLLKAARGQEPSIDIQKAQLKLAEIYFQYGRYLLISSSRPGSLPANLQGIWNKEFLPPWDSKYTININTEMNYWLAEICNLSECHQPLFDLLKRMQKNGKKVAEEMYGCRGFTAHNNTDIWADCAPQGTYIPATHWVMGAAWLCTHIWTHYLYTNDIVFLKEMYPVLEDAVLFFHDYLVEDQGEMVTSPSLSPENTYILPNGEKCCICMGPSMDSQILRDLFQEYLKASKLLGKEGENQNKTRLYLSKLPSIRIGKYGQIMEWREDYEEEEPGHRHIAQLYALHPSHQITTEKTPDLAKAAETTIEKRLKYGGDSTGWTCAWIANFYARLKNGTKAWENLLKLWDMYTLPNFMDCLWMGEKPVYQIEGNFGGTSAITEMLLQSDEEKMTLLPAIPACWSNGHVTGLKTVGGAAVDMTWNDGKLVSCTITAAHEMRTEICYRDLQLDIKLGEGESFELDERWICN